jgi:hypothetical protein
MGNSDNRDILPVVKDELHVQFGKKVVSFAKTLVGRGDPWKSPSLVDFFW